MIGLEQQRGFSGVVYAVITFAVVAGVTMVFIGEHLIYQAKAQKSIEALTAISVAMETYQESYGQLPGDDGSLPILAMRGDAWSRVLSGDVDGNLEAPTYRTFTGVDESGAYWQHLRAAGLIAGDPANTAYSSLPVNAFGGRIGVLSEDMGGGLSGIKLCLSRVPGVAATAIDTSLDDGDGATGELRASLATAEDDLNPVNELLADPYTAGAYYTLCYRVLPDPPPPTL